MSKRPVAFRVPRLCGDMVSHYFVTTSEDEARAMADTNQVEYEGLYLVGDRAAFECAARKQSLPEPAECNWPVCGCDPYADKVISALEESGHFPAQPQEAPELTEGAKVYYRPQVEVTILRRSSSGEVYITSPDIGTFWTAAENLSPLSRPHHHTGEAK